MEREKIAGLSVAVTDRYGIVYSEGFGCDSIERPEIKTTPKSLFRIASISKMITGMTVMRLCELGRLSLDDKAKKYVPWLSLPKSGAEKTITLRHLLSHTAGLPAEYTPVGSRDEGSLESFLKNGLVNLENVFMPGERNYLYSNWGIHLVSYIAEQVTGQRFTELAREYVLEPLLMNETTYNLCVAATYPLSLPHEHTESGEISLVHYMKENAARMAAGGIYSSSSELTKLARCVLNNGKSDTGSTVIGESSMEEMKKIHAFAGKEAYTYYGLTMMRLDKDGEEYYGHLGSAPPYSSSLYVHPRSGYGVITLINTEVKNEVRLEIPQIIFSEL